MVFLMRVTPLSDEGFKGMERLIDSLGACMVDEPMHAAASDADDRWLADFFERKGLKEGLRQPPSLRSDSGGGLRQGSEGGREDLVKVLEEADKVKK